MKIKSGSKTESKQSKARQREAKQGKTKKSRVLTLSLGHSFEHFMHAIHAFTHSMGPAYIHAHTQMYVRLAVVVT